VGASLSVGAARFRSVAGTCRDARVLHGAHRWVGRKPAGWHVYVDWADVYPADSSTTIPTAGQRTHGRRGAGCCRGQLAPGRRRRAEYYSPFIHDWLRPAWMRRIDEGRAGVGILLAPLAASIGTLQPHRPAADVPPNNSVPLLEAMQPVPHHLLAQFEDLRNLPHHVAVGTHQDQLRSQRHAVQARGRISRSGRWRSSDNAPLGPSAGPS
jgi:hypothetical protein